MTSSLPGNPGTSGNYPANTVLATALFSAVQYAASIYIMFTAAGAYVLGIYVLYVLLMELKLLRFSCTSCYYHGKACAFGKGRMSSLIFKKRDPKMFITKKISFSGLVPELLVSLIPISAGAVFLFRHFDIYIMLSMILLLVLGTAGNGYVRMHLACRSCRQRILGCPAEMLFSRRSREGTL
ncbi:MAG: hypothetical protein JXJ19_00295 [Elusimicrobia bacterium]|nr:hypothetical protein [Elusimicrobiota bacterium]